MTLPYQKASDSSPWQEEPPHGCTTTNAKYRATRPPFLGLVNNIELMFERFEKEIIALRRCSTIRGTWAVEAVGMEE